MVEITDGVQPGQPVVVRGAFQLAAEMLKVSGSSQMFESATEGDHEQSELVKEPAQNALNIGPQVIAVGIAIAFILGFCISAMLAKLRRNRHALAAAPTAKALRREGPGETEEATTPHRQDRRRLSADVVTSDQMVD